MNGTEYLRRYGDPRTVAHFHADCIGTLDTWHKILVDLVFRELLHPRALLLYVTGIVLSTTPSDGEILEAYRRAAFQYHPVPLSSLPYPNGDHPLRRVLRLYTLAAIGFGRDTEASKREHRRHLQDFTSYMEGLTPAAILTAAEFERVAPRHDGLQRLRRWIPLEELEAAIARVPPTTG